jgi:hypothetical protein
MLYEHASGQSGMISALSDLISAEITKASRQRRKGKTRYQATQVALKACRKGAHPPPNF